MTKDEAIKVLREVIALIQPQYIGALLHNPQMRNCCDAIEKLEALITADIAPEDSPNDSPNIAHEPSVQQDRIDAIKLLKRLKRDLMQTRLCSFDTRAEWQRACISAEGDIEEFLNAAQDKTE